MPRIGLYQMPQQYLTNNKIHIFHSFSLLSANYQSPGWPSKGRAHTGQSTHLHIWCFNFALHSDTFPPNNHHATSSLARKITSTAKIRQPTPKNRHDGEMVLSKIKLHQSFKQ